MPDGRTAPFVIPVLIGMTILLLMPASAEAAIRLDSGTFGQGYLRILGLPVHLAACLGAGLWAGQQANTGQSIIPLAFLVALVAMGLAYQFGVRLPFESYGLVGSVIAFGLLAAFALQVPVLASALAGLLAGVFHGHALGSSAAVSAAPLLYWSGAAVAVLLALAAGLGLSRIIAHSSSHGTVRGLGAAVCVAGILILVNVV